MIKKQKIVLELVYDDAQFDDPYDWDWVDLIGSDVNIVTWERHEPVPASDKEKKDFLNEWVY